MKRILLDQGLPLRSVHILRENSWDAIHVREIGMRDASDTDILNYAGRESRIVATLDRDFPQILALTSAQHPSVILIRQQRLSAGEVAALIAEIWTKHEEELHQGCVLKVSARGTRVRLLPLP
jgi:predicted nuclease of predicted toxin-antitoxin system